MSAGLSVSPATRVAVVLTAAVLFVLGLAYWWQGNLFHEIVGTLFLALLILHNLTVLRWYGALGKGRWTTRRSYATLINAAILLLMLGLAVTSLMVSQTLFAVLPINIGYSAREAHVLVAYWALVAMGLHLGLHWSRVINLARRHVAVDFPAIRWIARAGALVIALYGAYSMMQVLLVDKLLNIPALDMWDFTTNAGGFLLHYASIVGLFACFGHYLAAALQSLRSARAV